MNRAELKELQQQSAEHLESVLTEKQDYLLRQIRMRVAAGEGVNPHEAREIRREIAQIKTLIREHQLGIQQKRTEARKLRDERDKATA